MASSSRNTTSTTSNTITARRATIKNDTAEYLPLYRAIIRNDWRKAQEIFNEDKDALTAKINPNGDSALHIAMDKAENIQFVENLLKEITPESLPNMVNNKRVNPLHRAAKIDNTMVAKMLVKKNPQLLFILDMSALPIHKAIINSHKTTFLYLLDACKQYIELSQDNGYHSPFEGIHGGRLLNNAIDSGFLDVPTENNCLKHTSTIQDIENKDPSSAKFIKKNRFYSVPHIKHLQEEKLKHYEALVLLKRICEEVSTISIESDICQHYYDAIKYAVSNDTPEVIEEVIGSFPHAIWTKIDGYSIIQVAIRNRCEKVYNFLLCHLSYDKYAHQQRRDKEDNNLLHLAAQLAPIHKLNLVSGAALQMQRELQWFEVNIFSVYQ
ncbi:hypothetical protein L2E82_44992 [Cichorium intybus]|uniref:Uncharacterized protein n=1 Tax=Cichorium intybus TaxID=13427 RepID=A0ACB8ZSB4_CICIN|nr:hypothetical protein L2E82_44992 [Cichorium intybus]